MYDSSVEGEKPEAGAPELICEMSGIRGGDTGFPVSLICDQDSNRLMLRGINEGGYGCVDIDLLDVVNWLHQVCPVGVDSNELARAIAVFAASKRPK